MVELYCEVTIIGYNPRHVTLLELRRADATALMRALPAAANVVACAGAGGGPLPKACAQAVLAAGDSDGDRRLGAAELRALLPPGR